MTKKAAKIAGVAWAERMLLEMSPRQCNTAPRKFPGTGRRARELVTPREKGEKVSWPVTTLAEEILETARSTYESPAFQRRIDAKASDGLNGALFPGVS